MEKGGGMGDGEDRERRKRMTTYLETNHEQLPLSLSFLPFPSPSLRELQSVFCARASPTFFFRSRILKRKKNLPNPLTRSLLLYFIPRRPILG